jgi:hypothetical protein
MKSNAITYLNLVSERMGMPKVSYNRGSAGKVGINSLTYDNPNLGMGIQYPASWSLIEYPLQPRCK